MISRIRIRTGFLIFAPGGRATGAGGQELLPKVNWNCKEEGLVLDGRLVEETEDGSRTLRWREGWSPENFHPTHAFQVRTRSWMRTTAWGDEAGKLAVYWSIYQ